MASTDIHRIFYIPEILERILLDCDICTLLTSVQRVCHYWHDLILSSGPLQEALFFKPAKRPSTDRISNPLLRDKLWPQFFRKRFQLPDEFFLDEITYTFSDIDPIDEEVYLRKNASWRRMLIQQPPTPYIGIIEAYPGRQQDRPSFTRVTFRRHGGSFLMPLLLDGIVTAALMPQEKPWVFCDLDWVRANEISSTGESTVEDSEESAESTDSCDSDQEWFREDETSSTGKRTVKDGLLEDMHQLQSAVSQYLRKQEWFRAKEISSTGESTAEDLEDSADSTYSCDSDQEWIWEDETRSTGERAGERTVNQVVRELMAKRWVRWTGGYAHCGTSELVKHDAVNGFGALNTLNLLLTFASVVPLS
ncbi:hypothetical protein ANOM_010964 [Aspergillus nomiae NRRL 13137]|uniref:F-box domain-containing protein n=1 Tax=Aspergillus nomiae NRRL (strain ATCC 15546 / NRRL 13137 / CBS 260.88 / M93) TaxID=1509407 RepID=A0A0L1INJ6_ASPN3|nr:uncharacterized protein ANOM_010964 [Aspergillus nomiae NRRL 13137]KNG81062.1 hypothetical protein ANOM_010964 [Aspergillus nomiae NRRL 13137]